MKKIRSNLWKNLKKQKSDFVNRKKRRLEMMRRGQSEPSMATTARVFHGLVRQAKTMPLDEAQRKFSDTQTRRLFKITMDARGVLDEKKRHRLLSLAVEKTHRIDQLQGINRSREEDTEVRRIETEMTHLLGGPKKTRLFFDELKKVSNTLSVQHEILLKKPEEGGN